MEQSKKDSLKVTALTQRIAQLVAQYENDLAELRAEATDTIEVLQNQLQAKTAEVEALRAVSEEDATDATVEG